MTSQTRTHLSARRAIAMRAGILRGVAGAALLVCGLVLSAEPAGAARVCGERSRILERLEQKHDETPQAVGLSADGGVLEVLVSPEGGWTILVTYPNRPTCVVAIGKAWQSLTTLVGQDT